MTKNVTEAAASSAAEAERARFLAGHYHDLQGLRWAPFALVFAALAADSLPIGLWFLGLLGVSIVAAVALSVAFGRYYRTRFGVVSRRDQPMPPHVWLAWAVLVVTIFIVVPTIEQRTDLPISVFGLAISLQMAAQSWRHRRFLPHRLALTAVLAAVSVLPLGLWSPGGEHPLAMSHGNRPWVLLLLTLLFVVWGILDHRVLVRELSRPADAQP